MSNANPEFYIPSGNRRESYHSEKDCMALKNAKKVLSKPYDVVQTMPLEACPWCVSEE